MDHRIKAAGIVMDPFERQRSNNKKVKATYRNKLNPRACSLLLQEPKIDKLLAPKQLSSSALCHYLGHHVNRFGRPFPDGDKPTTNDVYEREVSPRREIVI